MDNLKVYLYTQIQRGRPKYNSFFLYAVLPCVGIRNNMRGQGV